MNDDMPRLPVEKPPIWKQMLDDRYECKVVEHCPYRGVLIVTDSTNGTELLNEEVSLAYGAMFGPDVDDVNTWQNRCVQVVDGIGG